MRGECGFAPRDTWPHLRIEIRPMPWDWKMIPRVWRDDVSFAYTFHWLFLYLMWAGNKPLFRERTPNNEDA
jgi:hypothetical protein